MEGGGKGKQVGRREEGRGEGGGGGWREEAWKGGEKGEEGMGGGGRGEEEGKGRGRRARRGSLSGKPLPEEDSPLPHVPAASWAGAGLIRAPHCQSGPGVSAAPLCVRSLGTGWGAWGVGAKCVFVLRGRQATDPWRQVPVRGEGWASPWGRRSRSPLKEPPPR